MRSVRSRDFESERSYSLHPVSYVNLCPSFWYQSAIADWLISSICRPLLMTTEAHHRFTNEEQDWGFTRFVELRKLFSVSEGRPKSIIEDDKTVITAFVRVLKDPTGVLWHNFHKSVDFPLCPFSPVPVLTPALTPGEQLRFQEVDRSRWTEEPGSYMLHELVASISLPHQQLPKGTLTSTLHLLPFSELTIF